MKFLRDTLNWRENWPGWLVGLTLGVLWNVFGWWPL